MTLDRRPFVASLRWAQRAAATFERKTIRPTADLNLTPFYGGAAKLNRVIGGFDDESIEVPVYLRGEASAFARAEALVGAIERMNPTIPIGADNRGVRRGADEAERYLRNLTSRVSATPVRLRVETDLMRADQQLRALRRLRDSVTDPERRIRVEAEVRRAEERLTAIREVARGVGASDPTIGITLYGARRVMSELLGIDTQVRRLDGRRVSLSANVDRNLSQALPQMLGDLGQQLTRFRTVAAATAAVTVPLLISKFAAMPAAISVASGAAGSFAVALAPGLVGALGAATGALTIGGAAVYGYGAALRRTWDYIGNFGDVISTQVGNVNSAKKAIKTLEESIEALPPGMMSAADKARAMALAEQDLAYQQQRLATMFQIATPRLVELHKQVNEARLGMLRFGGSIMHEVAPALSELIATGGRFGPAFSAGARGLARDMTGAALSLVRTAQSGQQLKSITAILGGIRQAGVPALGILGNSALAFVNAFGVVVPTGLKVLDVLSRLTERARAWTASAGGQSAITAGWGRAVAVGGQLLSVALNLGKGLWGVVSALNSSGVGQYLISAAVRLSGEFENLMRAGGRGREGIEGFMRSAKPILPALGNLALTGARAFLRLADAVLKVKMPDGGSALVAIIDSLRGAIGPLTKMLIHEFEVIGPLLPGLVKQVSEFAAIFVAATPEMQTFIRAITGVLGAFNSLPDPVQLALARMLAWGTAIGMLGGGPILGLVTAIGGMVFKWKLLMALTGRSTSVFGTLWGALSKLGPAFSAAGRFVGPLIGWFVRLGPLLLGLGSRILPMLAVAFGVITGPVGIAIGVVTALAGAAYLIYRNWGPIKAWFAGLFASLPAPVQQALAIVGNALRLGGQTVRAIFTGNWAPAIAAAKTYWKSLPGPVRGAVSLVGNALRLGGNLIRGVFAGNWAPAVGSARALWNGLPGPARTAASVVGNVLRVTGGVIRGIFTGNWSTAVNGARALFERLPGGVRSSIQRVGAFVRAGVGVVRAIFRGDWQGAINLALNIVGRLFPGVSGVLNRVKFAFNGSVEAVRRIFRGDLSGAVNLALSVVGRLLPGVRVTLERVRFAFNGAVAVVRRIFSGDLSGAVRLALAVVGRLFPGFQSVLGRVQHAARGGVAFVRALFSGDLRGAVGIALSVVGALFPGVRRTLDSVVGTVRGWIDRVRGMFRGLDLYQIGVAVIGGLVRGLQQAGGAVAEAARRLAGLLPTWLRRALGIASPAKKLVPYGFNAGRGFEVGILNAIPRVAHAVRRLAGTVAKEATSIAGPEVSFSSPSARIAPATGTAAAPAPVLSTRPAGSSASGVSVSVGGVSVSIGSIGNAGNLDEAERVTQEDVKKQIRAAFAEIRRRASSTPIAGAVQ